jgi:hypothetical protein
MPTSEAMQPLPGPLLPEDLLAEAVELLERLAAESSPSDEPQALRRMAALLATELGARGLSVAIPTSLSITAPRCR